MHDIRAIFFAKIIKLKKTICTIKFRNGLYKIDKNTFILV
ncbi:hypothetical protein HMPREF0204_12352 [Chryseobacterium gleum ATCC 35910]|uniref:Uncharacterized protein n=1 Tax=Chryseobacterium gleum ATCC 35910 TaxID=525257 RepID=A0ABN0AJX4_CHRGE|nr:hypothetical protein HMPREF0204_12352 [Chryseobacterium gleum ATCC 35910]